MKKDNFSVGVLFGKRSTDYTLGSSPIVKEILMPSLNWKEWSPEHEIQVTRFYDSKMCVTFSSLDSIEYQFTYALHNNKISPNNVRWLKDNGYFKNGYINFSERFIGALGETSNIGAYQYKVGDAIHNFGLIPQDKFPLAESFEENIDKKFITPEMYKLGKDFINRFPISYEWVDDVKDGLPYAPVQVCVYYLDGDGILCTDKRPIHAVLAVNVGDDFIEIDDSYQRQFKKYCPQAIYSAMLYTIKFNTKNNMMFLKEKNNKDIYLVNEDKKTKVMIVDMNTFNVFNEQFEEVDDLSRYANAGTLAWFERIIN